MSLRRWRCLRSECREPIPNAAPVSDNAREKDPEPGDVYVCFYCGLVMLWDMGTLGLELRRATPLEAAELATDREIGSILLAAQKDIRRRRDEGWG